MRTLLSLVRPHLQLLVVLLVGAAAAAAYYAARYWPEDPNPEGKYVYRSEDGDLCPRREANLRNERSVLPGIPHLASAEGPIPPNYRTLAYTYSTNSGMYRGTREFQAQKPPDTFRILVFGTGVSFGNGVDDDEVYPVLLEELLNRDGSRRYQVYNLAIPGSTTDRGVALLEKTLGSMAFDHVVFCYGVNDGLPVFKKSEEDYARSLQRLVALHREHGFGLLFAVEPRSTFYPWPFEGYNRRFREIIQAVPTIDVLDLPAILDAVEKDHGLRLERGAGEQKVVRYRDGEPTVLAEFDYAPGPDEQSVAPAVYDWLDISLFVDQACYIDGVHLSVEGHRVVAGTLLEYFTQSRKSAD